MNADPDPQAQPRARNYEEMTQDTNFIEHITLKTGNATKF